MESMSGMLPELAWVNENRSIDITVAESMVDLLQTALTYGTRIVRRNTYHFQHIPQLHQIYDSCAIRKKRCDS